MPIVTVWKNPSTEAVKLHQLSDDPTDGTAAEQIAHLGEVAYPGFTCVSEDYTGTAPEVDPAYWHWNGTGIEALSVPPPQPSTEQVRVALAGLGMTQEQLDALFNAAAQL